MDQAVIEWTNLNYYVPVKKLVSENVDFLDEELLANDDWEKCSAKGLPNEQIIRNGKQYFKKILVDSTGYVKPAELVAILGPSGSGKTTLLNALSQRVSLSSGSYTTGEIKINSKELDKGDYGKVGAFVQQDDVLMGTYTVRELIQFAAQIRTNQDENEIEEKVNSIIQRLGLDECKDTMVGGV